jgi:FkbM family methyltransferase
MLLFDIGANSGAYALAQLKTGKWHKIVCVDPCRKMANALKTVVRTSGGRVVYVPRAVSDKSGETLTFYESPISALSSLHKDWITSARFSPWPEASTDLLEYTVQTVRLDHLIKQFGVPDLIKVDVETHEEAVLMGLSQCVPRLCFEYAIEHADSVQRCVDRLKTLGFTKVHVQYEDAYTYVPPSWLSIDEFDVGMLQQVGSDRKDSWGMVWAS